MQTLSRHLQKLFTLFIDNDIKVEDPVVYELEALQYNEVVEWIILFYILTVMHML